jgi:nitrous oxide reductase accessory protein NosL
MRKYLVAAVLIGAFVAPAFAQTKMPGAGPYYVGLDTAAHTCSVVTEMKPGMKNMGQFKTQDEAEKAMADMKECKGAM